VAGDYAILAPHYNRIGLADFATRITPKVLNFVQQNGWMGRRILDLGCGTGACSAWFATHGYVAVGVDHSPEMLSQMRQAMEAGGLNVSFIEADIRQLEAAERIDLAVGIGVMNELDSLRDLEAVFQSMQKNLAAGRFFAFDLYTIEGLTEYGETGDQLVYENPDLIVFSRIRYDFERQICGVGYQLFQRAENNLWKLERAKRVMRAYPIQAIVALLRRLGFEIVGVVNTNFETVDITAPRAAHVIFVAKKL